MRAVIRTLAALVGAGAVAGAAVVFLGLYNVSAREGHWAGVGWILHTTFRNSVALRAPAEAPALTDDMVALGARHYDTGCRPCHGAPGEERMAAARAMEPEPPHITDAVRDWTAQELFWIVREGAKMTGMPAFPAPRDDEVWAVVAFLDRVAGMGGAEYAALTERPEVWGSEGLAYCAMCHDEHGIGGNPLIPRLDIQTEAYLADALRSYRSGTRPSGIMQQAASLFGTDELQALARHYAEPVANTARPRTEPEAAARGAALARRGTSDIPACAACHGPGDNALNPIFPRLAGQSEVYLAAQLRLWRDKPPTDGRHADLMRRAAQRLEDGDLADLAAYYAGLAPR